MTREQNHARAFVPQEERLGILNSHQEDLDMGFRIEVVESADDTESRWRELVKFLLEVSNTQ